MKVIDIDMAAANQDEVIEHFLIANTQYEIDALMLRYYKYEYYPFHDKGRLLNSLPFSGMNFKLAFGSLCDAKKVQFINGKYEFTFSTNKFGLSQPAELIPFIDLLVKYCYGVKSYEDLCDKCYCSNEPLLIYFMEQSKDNAFFSTIFSELIALLNRDELNPNIKISDILSGKLKPELLIFNQFAYSNIFKNVIEMREHNRPVGEKIRNKFSL